MGCTPQAYNGSELELLFILTESGNAVRPWEEA